MAKNRLNIILGVDVSALEKSLKRVERNLSRFARNIESAGRSLTESLTLPLAAVGGASLKAFGDIEKLEKGMAAITGSSEKAADELEKLRQIAEQPGLAFEQAVRGSIQLQAVGFSADAARESISALGKAVALTGGSAQELDVVVRQLTQINSKGRLLAEDLLVIQENAPAIGIALNDAFGTSNVEAIRATGISTGEFTERLIKAINASETFQGVTGGLANAFENFRNNTKFALAELGRTIAGVVDLEGVMNTLSTAIGNVVKFFKSLTPEAQKTVVVVAAVVAGIGPLLIIIGKLVGIAPLLVNGFRSVIGVVQGVAGAFTLANLQIVVVIGVIAGLAAGLLYLYNNFENVRRIVNAVLNVFGELAAVARDTFSKLVEGFANLREGNFKQAATNFAQAVTTALPGFGVGQRLGAAFSEGFQDESNRLQDGIDRLKKKIFADVAEVRSALTGTTVSTPTGGGFPTGGTSTGGEQATAPRESISAVIPLESFNAADQQIQVVSTSLASFEQRAQSLGVTTQEAFEKWPAGSQLAQEAITRLQANVDALGLSLNENNRAVVNLGAVGAQAINTFSSGFAEAIAGTQKFGKVVLRTLSEVIRVLVQQGVAAIIANTLQTTGKVLGPLAIPIAAAAGVAASALFNKLVGLADGGIIPPGFPNDTFPARLSSGEAVIPLDRLNSMVGGQNVFIPDLTVRGEDLVIAFRRAESNFNRYS